MTSADVMVALTAFEFAYTQASVRMKSVLQACFLLTNALGNFIVMIIAGAGLFHSLANEFFLFATLMAMDTLLFIILAKSYKSVASQHQELNPLIAPSTQ